MRTLLAAGFIELGASDNIALDQPRVAVELAKDVDSGPGVQWESIGPGLFNTFLLDTGASSVLAMATAIADIEQSPLGYEVQGALLETGVAGDHLLDVSIPYRFDFAGSNGIRHTLTDARIMSDATKDFSSFGPWGLVGMPAMEGRVTSLDFTGWSGGGLDLDSIYMDTEFRDDVPASSGHRYTVSLDNRLSFDPLDQMVSGQPPIWGEVPFLTGVPKHNGIAQEGNFLFDTGAQISVISQRLAIDIGLDSNGDGVFDASDDNYVTQQVVGGVGGQISVPVFGFDEFHVPTDSGEDLVWTNLEWLVLDISTPGQTVTLDGVFGSDLLTSGWFHAFFSPGQPDGYINQMHMDFREMGTTGQGKVHFDLNPDVDNVVLPGPGIIVRQSFRTTDVGEGGETDSYNIVLTGAPTDNVTITLDNADGQVTAENAANGTNTLVFTPQNWEIPQTVLVTAVNDVAAEGNHQTLITHTVSSGDSGYDGRSIADVRVRVTDDDLNLLEITADQAGRDPIGSVEVAEGGDTIHYWVALSERPASEIWVLFEDTTGQVEGVKADNPQLGLENVLMFNSGNWNQPQRVAINAVNDTDKEGSHEAKMVHTVLDVVNFADPIIGQTPLPVSITDDDLAEFLITPSDGSTGVSEAGSHDTYQIAPNLAPRGTVQITVAADAQTQVSIDGGQTFAASQVLSFTSATPQTITVAAIDDDVVEDTHFGTIGHSISGEINDTRFDNTLVIDDVAVTIADNDDAGLAFTTAQSSRPPAVPATAESSPVANTSVALTEAGDNATYWVALTSQPRSDVTVVLANTDGQAHAVDAAEPNASHLMFSPSNWATPQAVSVLATNDPTVEGFHRSQIEHRVLSADLNYHGSVLLPIEITDDDLAGFTVGKNLASVTEGGITTDSFTVALTSRPMSDVVISVESSDPGEAVVDQVELRFTPDDWDIAQTVQITGVNDGIVDGDQSLTIQVDIIDEQSFDPFDALGKQTIVVTTVDVDNALFDFGDAPSAIQSGFAGDYPVTLSADGARHTVGSLFLGTRIDAEANGLPDPFAGRDGPGGDDGLGQDDEDGVVVGSMVSSDATSTTSSVAIAASNRGKLDAWIDFNQDGDWNDPGEQIIVSGDVAAGQNLFGFAVPSSASVGDTAARFRLSSAGGLAPVGAAPDGEVEDYLVAIRDGAQAPAISLEMFQPNVTVALGSSDVLVHSGPIDLFRAPIDNIGSLSIQGTAGDDAVTVDISGGTVIPGDGLDLTGDSGNNTLAIIGSATIDLTDPRVTASQFNHLDLSSSDAVVVMMDSAAVARMSPTTGMLVVGAGAGDRLVLIDADQWRMSEPVRDNGQFMLTANNSAAGGSESLQAEVPHAWHNLIQSGDVNNDGSTTALDALRIVNELGRRQYSDGQTQRLVDPNTLEHWPGVYFDQNGDDQATALDALRVINELARRVDRGGSVEGQLAMAVLIPSARFRPAPTTLLLPVREDPPPPDQALVESPAAAPATTAGLRPAAASPTEDSIRAVDQLLADHSSIDELLPVDLLPHVSQFGVVR